MSARRLLIMRHAHAEHGAVADADRALTKKGRRAAEAAGERLADAGFLPDQVICSTARRAWETWKYLRANARAESAEFTVVQDLYSAGVDDAFDLVNQVFDEVGTLLLLGHNPTMAELAQAFADPDADGPDSPIRSFPPASIAVVELDVPWLYAAPGTGTVRML